LNKGKIDLNRDKDPQQDVIVNLRGPSPDKAYKTDIAQDAPCNHKGSPENHGHPIWDIAVKNYQKECYRLQGKIENPIAQAGKAVAPLTP